MATFRKKDPRQGVDSDEETVRAAEKAIQDGFAEKKGVLKSLFAAKPPKTAPRGPVRENGGKRALGPDDCNGCPARAVFVMRLRPPATALASRSPAPNADFICDRSLKT